MVRYRWIQAFAGKAKDGPRTGTYSGRSDNAASGDWAAEKRAVAPGRAYPSDWLGSTRR
jgi:hypothetical protein